MYFASSEPRYRQADAMSSGVAARFIGIRSMYASRAPGTPDSIAVSGVSVRPGETALTLMPLSASSSAPHLDSIATPALAVQYAAPPNIGTSEFSEETL